ncbi:MAG: hypothetical protein ORN24_03095, partial [Burkholderiales bacterium]|nr:hypothetical protein [Burkholderiales bacterium]
TLNKLTAPILSFTSEQVSDYYQIDKQDSIHLQNFADITGVWQELVTRLNLSDNANLLAWQTSWENLFAIRDALLKAIEEQRALGLIKHPLEARLEVCLDINQEVLVKVMQYVTSAGRLTGQNLALFLKEFLIVSQVELHDNQTDLQATQVPGLFVSVTQAQGIKCPRCWKYDVNKHIHNLCTECQIILG